MKAEAPVRLHRTSKYCKSKNFGGYKIWRLPVYAVYDRCHFRMLAAINISENTQFAKYNGTKKFVDLQ